MSGRGDPGLALSVVIPVLNEASYLPATLSAVAGRCVQGAAPQVVVTDCGSTDGSAEIARAAGVEVLVDPGLGCRGEAANTGASRASGEVLLFLDADSLPPPGYDLEIRRALARRRAVGGAFELRFDGRGAGLRLVELVDRVRYRVRGFYYGDQGLFVRREVFRRVGGFPPVPLFETAELCRRLRREGRLVLVHRTVATSPRRFVEGGVLRVFAHDLHLWFRHLVGLPTAPYGAAYWAENRRRGGGGTRRRW